MTSDTEVITRTGKIRIHDEAGFEGMRLQAALSQNALDMIIPMVPDVTTESVDKLIYFVMDIGALRRQSAIGYRHASCISVNHVVCHGIPVSDLQEWRHRQYRRHRGCYGWHGDSSRMYGLGDVKRKAERLMDVTYESLMANATVKPGARVGDIGGAISAVAARNRVSVVDMSCGHGLVSLPRRT